MRRLCITHRLMRGGRKKASSFSPFSSSVASATRGKTTTATSTKKMSIRRLVDSEIRGNRVLVRTDFNVPLDKETGEITDDTRIRAALPTLRYLVERGSKVVVCTHLGRPKGKAVESMRLDPVARRLSELLDNETNVSKVDTCVGPDARKAAERLQDGDVLLLENVRFHAEEERNDPGFARQLRDSSGATYYVNDAFGTAHRAHASTEGVAHFVDKAVAGFLMEKELDFLQGTLRTPKRPFVAVTGGAKVSSKLPVLSSLLAKVDSLLLGGGMIFTFLKAQGVSVGDSLLEKDMVPLAKKLMSDAETSGVRLMLPEDIVVTDSFQADATTRVVSTSEGIPDGWIGVDIGPRTIRTYAEALKGSKTVIWNGPMGVFEMEPFAKGTFGVADAIAECSDAGALSIIGGGDSVAAVESAGLAGRMSHISTGGGASLELLEGKVLPGVAALHDDPLP